MKKETALTNGYLVGRLMKIHINSLHYHQCHWEGVSLTWRGIINMILYSFYEVSDSIHQCFSFMDCWTLIFSTYTQSVILNFFLWPGWQQLLSGRATRGILSTKFQHTFYPPFVFALLLGFMCFFYIYVYLNGHIEQWVVSQDVYCAITLQDHLKCRDMDDQSLTPKLR